MAISVDGYGNITQGNAKEIYVAWKRGEVELSQVQQKKCESFLSPEELDEVQYDSGVTQNRGKNAVDASDTSNKGGAATAATQTAATGGALAGTIVAICGGMSKLTTKGQSNGFTSLACAVVAAASSAIALAMAFAFDPALKDRKNHSDNAANDNQTMDGYSENLTNTMDMMNEDVQTYNEQQANLTKTVNTQTSQMADLQMQYDAAVAMGDKQGAQAIKEKMLALQKQDNSGLEDELAETGSAIEDYRAMNVESAGCAESGQTVADFLKDGKPMGAVATTSAILATATTVLLGIATVVGAIPKIWSPIGPVDGPPAILSAISWAVATLAMGTTATKMWSTASAENECGSNGDDMQDHVNNLNEMITQQDSYTTDTEGAFEESDEAAAESKSEASEKAGESVAGNKETLGNKPQGSGQDDGAKEDKPASVII